MKNKALIVIDLQNDITKNYKMIIGQVNEAIDWAMANEMHIIYIKQKRQEHLSRIPKVLNWFLNLRSPQRMFLKSQKPVR